MRYKIILSLSIIFAFLVSCSNNNAEKLNRLQQQTDSLQQENLFLKEFVNIVSECIDSVSSTNVSTIFITSSDSPVSQKDQLLNKVTSMGASLEQQRTKINELEGKLSKINPTEAVSLKKIIASLKQDIARKDSVISRLKEQIQSKDADISKLTVEVNELNELTTQQEEILTTQDAMLNEAYVCIGTASELNNKGLFTKGSLFKKKKINLSDVNIDNFEKIDIRTKDTFSIPAKKIKILTPVIEGTYEIVKNAGTCTLTITNPNKFWSVSNYLIIQVN